MGAREIVLIGYDMGVVGKRHNFHREYDSFYEGKSQKLPKPDTGHYRKHLIRPFPRIAEDLAKLEIKCWNTCMSSELVVFPKVPLEELL
jgi:hypothetical protein